MLANHGYLSLRQLCLGYLGKLVVEELSLSINKGEMLGLLGPNGSGKTTTIHAITGNLQVTSGSIFLDGVSIEEHPETFKKMIGFVPQELAIYEELSPFENLWFFGKNYRIPSRQLHSRIADVLKMVRLDAQANIPSRNFSGGMKRRLNIACALLHNPGLLLLDEPTVGLDPLSREAVFECLENLRSQGCAIIYTSHYYEEIARLCDQIGVMSAGRLVFRGSMEEFHRMLSSKTPWEKKHKKNVPIYRFDENSITQPDSMENQNLDQAEKVEKYLMSLSIGKAA